MARTKPNILLSEFDGNETIYVYAANAFYCVTYDGKPFTYKYERLHPKKAKYLKTTYTNKGFADNLAEYLNIRFNTDKFAVKVYQKDGEDCQYEFYF